MLRHIISGTFLLIALSGCAGYSVHPLALSPDGITMKWDGLVEEEQRIALAQAEAHCQQYRKHARPIGSPTVIGTSNAVSQSFRCVP